MDCLVSDEHTESYLSAKRSQPSCSNRVNSSFSFVTVMMLSRLALRWIDRSAGRCYYVCGSTAKFIIEQGLLNPPYVSHSRTTTIYSSGNSIGSSSSRGTSLFRSMIRAQVFQQSNASSWPGGRIASSFSNQLIASRKSSYSCKRQPGVFCVSLVLALRSYNFPL